MANSVEHPRRAGGRRSGFQNRELVCSDCGRKFIFTEGEQRFYREKGLESAPRRCPACRNQRKSRTQDAKERRPGPQTDRRQEQRRGGCISGKVFAQMSQKNSHRRQGNHQYGGASRGNSGGRQRDTRQGRPQSSAGHPITCARCGRQAHVPFTPRNRAVVYCPDCYRLQKRQRR